MNTNPIAIFVPWLHMHQPPIWSNGQLIGNLEKMLNGTPNSEEHWNAQWFAQAYKNPARYAKQLTAEGYQPRMIVDYSGVLLEEMAKLSKNGTFSNLHVDGEAMGDVISLWREILNDYPDTIEFTGSGYSHCYFPATPERNHEAQIMEWRRVFADLFGEEALSRVRGFWPPEMGITGNPGEALRFIRLLKKCGYEWIILPNAALEHPEGWSTPELENRVHWLVVESEGESERILCVVRDTDMGIRQQSGQNADGCINDVRYRGKEVGTKPPALVVPTSDGENGNVMMFEYFKNSFAPLFRERDRWSDVGFMTVSQYIDTYLTEGPTTEVRLKSTGGSWIGGHQQWQEGDLRQQVLAAVEQLSQDYAKIVESGKGSAEKTRILLFCETSCFVYWGSDFWADQAKLCIEWARKVLAEG
ncbi:MAG: glycoside hydrolase [Microcoleaceae cyanobacterium MO_207.B10]|nr:glycoside hydrolase [Microcoleaceae cyanobacterium MO_207.B10]